MIDIEWKYVRPVVYASLGGGLLGRLLGNFDSATLAERIVYAGVAWYLFCRANAAIRRLG